MSRGHTILAVNGGSSSIKYALFTCSAHPELLARGAIDDAGSPSIPALLAWVDTHVEPSALSAVGHRLVHGGPTLSRPQAITAAVRADLAQLVPFAPNHLPQEIAIVDALEQHAPGIPQIACFDTAFHADMPDVARRLPIPGAFDRRGIRRYGFHGLSYSYLMEELALVGGEDAARGRIILAHLGNGSSIAAVRHGVSIDTTMAFTPIGGVVMSTRSGDLDPGVVTYLGRAESLSADQVEDILSHQSGLLGISGTTGDMRQLLASEADDPAARLAVDVYVYSVVKAIGGFAAILGGVDTLVFSGGIGEHAAVVRSRVCTALAFLGFALDGKANDAHAAVISVPSSRTTVRVIPTNEELMIARATWRVLSTW